jgi:phosphoribosylamine---glycine ligase
VKILVVGSGGREHAIVWKLKQDDHSLDIIVAPGNPGISQLARCANVAATDISGLLALAENERPDLTVVGPEAPLAAGIADGLRSRGFRVFGPNQGAAQIESSKRFSKELMLGAGIPTAEASSHRESASAKRAVREVGAPVVIKASGLAAGKGVFVCETLAEADLAIDALIVEHALGAAGNEVLVEEFLEGEELSVFAITDGENFLTMLPSQDHKRLLDGDDGPNTGGMGAYAPVAVGTSDLLRSTESTIIAPALAALRENGTPFSGLLYAGIMVSEAGLKVVEFNCRFGDPETEVVLPLLASHLCDALMAASEYGGLRGASPLSFSDQAAVTTVISSPGYPESPRVGLPISLGECPAGSMIFHAGTRLDANGGLVTSGGRVFAVTGIADSFEDARAISAEGAGSISFDGAHFRRDIGWREMGRRARAS